MSNQITPPAHDDYGWYKLRIDRGDSKKQIALDAGITLPTLRKRLIAVALYSALPERKKSEAEVITDAKFEKLLELVASGMKKTAACKRVGMSFHSMQERLNSRPKQGQPCNTKATACQLSSAWISKSLFPGQETAE
jgi:hypothetical protein